MSKITDHAKDCIYVESAEFNWALKLNSSLPKASLLLGERFISAGKPVVMPMMFSVDGRKLFWVSQDDDGKRTFVLGPDIETDEAAKSFVNVISGMIANADASMIKALENPGLSSHVLDTERELIAAEIETGYVGQNEPVPPRQLRADIAAMVRRRKTYSRKLPDDTDPEKSAEPFVVRGGQQSPSPAFDGHAFDGSSS